MTQFWFILASICMFIELLNPGLFFFLALSLAALATMLAEISGHLFINQYAFFFMSTAIMFGLLHKLVGSLQQTKKSTLYRSNTSLLIGKTVEIIEVVAPDLGYAKVEGEIWQVKLQNKDQHLSIGMHGLVVGIKGCHLQITPIQ